MINNTALKTQYFEIMANLKWKRQPDKKTAMTAVFVEENWLDIFGFISGIATDSRKRYSLKSNQTLSSL